jgi:hypothetical protein
MTPLIDDETATRYWSERDTAPEAERESRNAALIDWAKAKKADQFRAEQQQAESAYTDLEGWWKENGAGHVFEKDEDRLEVANRRFIANQFQQTPDQQGRYYPTYRDEYLQKTFGKSGLSETDTFNLIRDSLTARKATEDALRELPGALAKGMFSKVAEGKTLDETDSWFLFQDWKDRHADKLGKLPEGWESAMLDRAVKLQARSETMMRDLAPESKRAFDTLMAFTRPEDAEALPEAGRADVENIAKEFAKLTPEDRQNIYSTLYYAAEADGAGMGKGFFEKVGEGIARGGVNIYNDAEMTAQDRQARQNISEFQSLLDKPEQQPDRMQTAESIKMQRDMAKRGVEENTQRLAELKALREIRQIADGTIDPIKTEMDGVMGSIVQGAYDFSQSAAYTGLAAVPYVGLPAVMGALTNSNYLRMLDTYPDMDADAALAISGAIAAPQAFIERFQGRALVGKSPMLNSLMKKMTDVRIPIAGRLAIGYGANVAYQTGQEFVQEAMPVAADQIAAAIREDMPEFDAEKAWGAYKDQMPDIFFSMLWAGLIGTGTSTFREFKRNGQFERSLGELEMVGITGEAAQDIAAEQDLDVANTKFQEAWSNRTPEDIQAGIAKRAAQLEAASSTQQNPELPVRRIEENADGTLTHIIEKPDGTVLYRTNDSDAADTAFVNITGMVGRSQLTGTTRGIVESLQFIDQVNQAAGRGEDVQKLLLDDAPRNLLDEYEANPTEQNLNNLFETVRSQGQDINEPAELANFPVLASNQGALVDGVFRSIIKIQDGATGDKVMRDFSQDNLKRAIAEGRITMDWVRENLNQVIPLIESERNTGPALRTETDTDVIESFSDVAVAYMTGRIREEQIPQGFRGFLRRMAIIVKDIFRRSYNLKRAIAEGKVDSNFEGFLAESVGLNQQTMVDTTRERVGGELAQGTFNYSVGQRVSTDTNPYPMEDKGKWWANEDFAQRGGQIVTMSPDEFLSQVRPLEVDEASRDNIDDLKNMMQSGRKLDPLAIYADGKEDGRHRATAAKELGMDTLPVLDFRANKPEPKGNDFSIGSRASAVSTDTPSIRASNATISGPANYSIAAHHGTPHKVDKFSTAKIGTGEGAQAYGWGLYFADKKPVAQSYRRVGATQADIVLGNGNQVKMEDLPTPLQNALAANLEAPNPLANAKNFLTGFSGDYYRKNSFGDKAVDDSIAKLDEIIQAGGNVKNVGNLYTVDLDVEPEDLLDWDKPFSEQSPKVQAALKAVQSDNPLWKDTISGKNGKPVGGAIYKTLTATWPDAEFSRDGIDPKKKASEALLAAGIPGIRYLDGGSRSDGQGTYNYVAFDENLIKITEENGNRIPASQALAAPATGVAVENGRAYSPIVRDLLQRRAAGEDIPRSVIDQAISDNFPAQLVEPPKAESELPSRATIDDAINEGQRRDQIAKSNIQPGEAVTIRQDVPAMTRKGVGVVTIKGKSGNSYDAAARISDPQFILNEKKSLEIGMGGAKGPHIAIRGKWSSDQSMPADLNQWTQVGFNPDRHSFYYDRATMKQVVGGSEAYQIGNTVFVKDAQFGDGQISNISYSIGKKQSAGGIRFDEITKEDPKHDGSRVGTAWQGKVKPTTQQTNDGIATIKPNELEKQMAMLTQFVDGVPLPKFITKFKDAKKRMRAFIDFQKGNLLALYDAFDALSSDYVIRSTHWYDGARLLAEGVRDNYRLTIEQSSAIISVFSPMKDWFQNVAMGQRFADVMANHKNKKITKATMGGAMREMLDAAEDDRKIRKAFKQIEGRSISQLLKDKSKEGRTIAAVAVRLMSTNVHGLTHDVLSPEGESLGIRKNLDGTNKKLVWQSYTFIEKAISIYEDGSAKNISKVLGTEHKIRNFYNNIVAPTSPFGDATVDTHAVNAAVLYPMGNKGYLVGLNFGNAGVAGGGNSGIYWLFHEALREAAKERGVMPRQMQSITWEAIRGLFTDIRKRDKNFVAGITKIWETSSNADAARTQIIGLGITPPEWARVGSSNSGGEGGMRSSTGQVADSAGSVQSGIRQGRQGGDRRAGVNFSIASQSEIDRVNKALGGMNRGPDERLKVYERARAKFGQLLESNKEAIDAIKSAKETDTAPALEQVETERASNLADLTAEENAEVAKALQDNADTFMPRIEAAATPAERKRVERDAKDRAKILEQGIRNKFDERKTAIDTKAKSQSQQIKDSAANRDSASRARMTEKVRRTKLLQSIGELDAVLSVLPPEIRGKVGGFAVLANIGTGDKALSDFFVKRIEMIDRQLERTLRKEYDAAFRKLLDRTKPKKAAPGEKPKGIGADIQDLFTVVRSAVDMDAVSVAAHIAGLDSKIASGELTAEQEARAQVEAALVSLVGDWRNADADRRRSALTEATRIWSGAYAAHTQKVIQLREQREVARMGAIQDTGKSGELAGRKSKAIADSGLKGSWKDYILNLLNFDQVAGILFGENSETANTLIDRQRTTENAKEDGQQAKMQALEGFFTDLAGGNLLAGEQLRYNLAQPSMEVQGIKLSELEGLSAAMMWEQEDGRRHMTGELDETGKPSGSWHYDQDFVDEIIANLSPEALQLRDWLLKQYADEYGNINAVYAELNGVNLPQIRNYSPVTVQPISAPTGQVLDPVSGSAMSGASTSPGALRTRGTAIAEPRFADVLQTYISHTLQMEHWKAFAPFVAEVNGVLRNRDVQNSVEEKGGAEARKILNAWLDYFAQGGTRDAGAHLALNQGISNVLGRASQVALIGRVSTLLVQSTQLGAALAEMPLKAYLKRMGKLLTGQLGWDASINSPYIQRRIAQMPPVVQMAMQGLKGAKPTAIQQAGKRLGNLLSGADGLFTAGTYAITYDYHLTKAQELGLTGAEAESYARNIAERVTDRIAQPTRPGARSLYENTSTNPLARAGWAFASEARKNLALVAYSFAERDTATKMRTLAYVVAINSIASSILRSIWRDMLDDDDEELFDDKYWSPKRIALAVATEPLYGFPVLGSTAQNAIYRAFGEYQPGGTMFDVDRAINPVKRIPEYLEGDFEMRDVIRDIDMIVSAMGLAHPNIAAAASITHLAKDLFNIGDSAVDAVTEE